MAKERADVHAREAFKDSQELLNGCCLLQPSRLLFPLSALCRETVTEPQSHGAMRGSTATFTPALTFPGL